MKNETSRQLTFKIVTIEIIEAILNKPILPILEGANFQFDISLEQRIDQVKGLVIVICTINILNDARDQQLSRIISSCIFAVNNLDSYTNKKSKTVDLPEEFRVNLNSISISTTRGIMFTYLKGTYLHHAILPIVNPSSFKLNKTD